MDWLASLDWLAIIKIVGIDIMLGGDNAIVIALACAALPEDLRRYGIAFGTAGAVILRGGLLFVAGWLMAIPALKLIAGAYLLYVGWKLLSDNEGGEDPHVKQATTIWAAVGVIMMADFMMSLDNVLAVTAASQSAGAHATTYAILGIVLSIPIIVIGATAIVKLMDRFPIIIWLGAGLLGWVGAEMMISDPLLEGYITRVHMTMGEYTHLSYKIAGFTAVCFAVLGMRHFRRIRNGNTGLVVSKSA